MSTERLRACAKAHRPLIDAALDGCLPPVQGPAGRLAEAMRYSVFAGGKRFRPMLVLMACDLCGGEQRAALPADGASSRASRSSELTEARLLSYQRSQGDGRCSSGSTSERPP